MNALQCEYDRRFRPRPLPAEPTQELPGSAGKVAVLEARLAAGVALWHPLDLRDGHSARDGYDVHDRPPPTSRKVRGKSRPMTYKLPRSQRMSPAPREVLPEGVCNANSGRRPFIAFVRLNGLRVLLGKFRTLEAAAETARRARELVARQESEACS